MLGGERKILKDMLYLRGGAAPEAPEEQLRSSWGAIGDVGEQSDNDWRAIGDVGERRRWHRGAIGVVKGAALMAPGSN